MDRNIGYSFKFSLKHQNSSLPQLPVCHYQLLILFFVLSFCSLWFTSGISTFQTVYTVSIIIWKKKSNNMLIYPKSQQGRQTGGKLLGRLQLGRTLAIPLAWSSPSGKRFSTTPMMNPSQILMRNFDFSWSVRVLWQYSHLLHSYREEQDHFQHYASSI